MTGPSYFALVENSGFPGAPPSPGELSSGDVGWLCPALTTPALEAGLGERVKKCEKCVKEGSCRGHVENGSILHEMPRRGESMEMGSKVCGAERRRAGCWLRRPSFPCAVMKTVLKWTAVLDT